MPLLWLMNPALALLVMSISSALQFISVQISPAFAVIYLVHAVFMLAIPLRLHILRKREERIYDESTDPALHG